MVIQPLNSANILSQYCATIVIVGKDQPRLSITTHYTGDVHSKYMDFYDTFLLKSLNAFDSNDRELYVTKQGEKIHVEYFCSDCPNPHARYHNIAYFDRVINCTGWKFDESIFDESMNICLGSKFPQINGRYEHVNYPNLFFVGALMHSLDYKRSSGGFIHGFRYLIESFININFAMKFQNWVCQTIEETTELILYRINVSSALYQMYGQMCDVFFVKDDSIEYIINVPLSYLLSSSNSVYQAPLNFPNPHP